MKTSLALSVAVWGCMVSLAGANAGRLVAHWTFDDMPSDGRSAPEGWTVGNWGRRTCAFGSQTGADGRGRAMNVDMTGNFGGELQIFSPAWPMWQQRWYRVSFLLKGIDHPGKISVCVRKIGYPWTMYGAGNTFRPTNGWQRHAFAFCAKADVQSGFGVMVSTGSIGHFLLDDVMVEEFDANPDATVEKNNNPPVAGNLVPSSSCEAKDDNFFINTVFTGEAWSEWQDARPEWIAGGKFGRRALWFPKRPYTAGETVTRPMDVASGQAYTFSLWAKCEEGTAHVRLGGWDGRLNSNKWRFGKTFPVAAQDGWVRLEVTTPPVPEDVRQAALTISCDNGHAVRVDGLQFELGSCATPYAPAAPHELELAFDAPTDQPAIVPWGRPLPLRLAAHAADGPTGTVVHATLRVTAYPNRLVHERCVELVAGGKTHHLDVEPNANGLLRVELVPQDASSAARCERVLARLPPPRGLGERSRFGTHFRLSPYFIRYARAIGMGWERLHDCSGITKMSCGNPKPGEWRWFDEPVDAVRAAGIAILGLPDGPPAWAHPVDAQGKHHYDAAAFAAWCEQAAAHYAGRIDHWEVWNEPYISGYFFRGTAAEFGPVFNAGAAALRKGNPSAKVVGWCTELSSPDYVKPFLESAPVAARPDINSMHYYFCNVPGDGDTDGRALIANMRKTFGARAAPEIWNTEGNLSMTASFYTFRRTPPEDLEEAVAFGARCWADTFANGIAKLFLYSLHNTDRFDGHGLMNLADYDRAVSPVAAATAVTAYFIDGLEPAPLAPPPEGMRVARFRGDGRSVSVLWDDVLVPGRARLDCAALPQGGRLWDAMGNELVDAASVEVGRTPVFVVVPQEQ